VAWPTLNFCNKCRINIRSLCNSSSSLNCLSCVKNCHLNWSLSRAKVSSLTSTRLSWIGRFCKYRYKKWNSFYLAWTDESGRNRHVDNDKFHHQIVWRYAPAWISFAGFYIQVIKAGGRSCSRQKNQGRHHHINADGMQTRAYHDPDDRPWRLIIKESVKGLFFWLVTFLNILHFLLIGACKILFIGFVRDTFDPGFLQAFADRYVGFWLLIPVNNTGLAAISLSPLRKPL